LIGLGCIAGAALALVHLLAAGSGDLASALRAAPLQVATLLGEPFLAALLAALVVGARRRAKAALVVASRAAPAAEGRPPGEEGLRLLGLLQKAGRFLDFLESDLRRYSDGEIGSAMRSVHAGCRTALEGPQMRAQGSPHWHASFPFSRGLTAPDRRPADPRW